MSYQQLISVLLLTFVMLINSTPLVARSASCITDDSFFCNSGGSVFAQHAKYWINKEPRTWLIIGGVYSRSTSSLSPTLFRSKDEAGFLKGVSADLLIASTKLPGEKIRLEDYRGLTKTRVLEELRSLSQASGNIGVYFSGHGTQQGDWSFANNETISSGDLNRILGQRSDVMIIADCCFSARWSLPKSWLFIAAAHGHAYDGENGSNLSQIIWHCLRPQDPEKRQGVIKKGEEILLKDSIEADVEWINRARRRSDGCVVS